MIVQKQVKQIMSYGSIIKVGLCKIMAVVLLVILTITFVIQSSSMFRGSERNVFGDRIVNGTIVSNTIRLPILDGTFSRSDGNAKCEKEICFRKCCPTGQTLHYYNQYEKNCSESDRNLTLDDVPFLQDDSDTIIIEKYGMHHQLTCTILYERKNFSISYSGILIEFNNTENKFAHHDPNRYCMELAEANGTLFTVSYICEPDYLFFSRSYIYLSLVSFFVTFLVHAILPELRNTTHGLCLLSHTASLFLAYSVIAFKPRRPILGNLVLYEYNELYVPRTEQIILGKLNPFLIIYLR